MSEVYAATHRNGKAVAVKVLHAELAGSQASRRRFLREGYIANRIAHDGVASIIDDDVTSDGTVFLVMDLLEGRTLEQHCDDHGGVVPVSEVIAVADAVLDVLVTAHEKGIVHRDIKPSNVFLTTKGTMKLLDFGIASLREMSASAGTTRTGFVLGTPGFIAPEQARGRWKEIDARTDLWGLGAMMFRLLSGRVVHEGETTNEAVIAAATQDAAPLASVAPQVPAGLARLVDRALCKKPDDRWPSAAEMQRALRSERATLPATHMPVPRTQRDAPTLDEPSPLSASLTIDAPLSAASSMVSAPPPVVTKANRRPILLGMGAALSVFLAIVAMQAPRSSAGSQRPVPQPLIDVAGPAAEDPSAIARGSEDARLAASSTPEEARSAGDAAVPTAKEAAGGSAAIRPARLSAAPRGTRRSPTHEAPPDPAISAPSAPLPTPSRSRLEDVLDERQ
jgi:serine/threonine-protein kinase